MPVPGRTVHGVLWEVTDAHLTSLDRHEGVAAGLYRRAIVPVSPTGTDGAVDAVMYIDDTIEPGPPRDGYMDKVTRGATEHRLPDAWLTYLRGWSRAGQPPADPASGPQTLTELLRTPGVHESVELGSRFGFMAIHGGELEVMTDIIAARVAVVVGEHLDGFTIVTDLDDIPPGLRGLHPDNPVNLPRHGGVQLELPPRLRGLSPLSPPAGPDGLTPPTRALIDGLAEVARSIGQTPRP